MRKFLLISLSILITQVFAQDEIKYNGCYFGEKGWLPGSNSIIVTINKDTAILNIYSHYYTDSYYFIKSDTLFKSKKSDLVYIGDSTSIIIKKARELIVHDLRLELKKKIYKTNDQNKIRRIQNLAYADNKSRQGKESGIEINKWKLYKNNDIFLDNKTFRAKVDSTFNRLIKK